MAGADPLAPIPLFAYPLFTSRVAGFEEHQQPLVTLITGLRDRFPGVVRSNRNAWHSGSELARERNEHLAWVLQKAQRFASLALAPYYQQWAQHTLAIGGCWANVLGPGGWNAPHHHAPSDWSGVFYVSVGTAGSTPGDPSGMIEFVNPSPWQSAFGRGGNYLHGPKDGVVLVFPASLHHFVHPHHQPGEERISIAFNFHVAPKGAPGQLGSKS